MLACSSRLPLQPSTLIGRDDDVAAACARLSEPDVRLLTLVGPPGVGKTRLALAVATRLADSFARGAVFVDLVPVADPAAVLSVIGHHLGVQEQAGGTSVEHMAAAIGDGDLLVVLDNFEHLLDAAPVVSGLLARCAGLRVLVTSRAPLDLRWERRFPVVPLPEAAAQALFVERARAAVPGFSPSTADKGHITRVVNRLDRLPLSIELAAAHAAILPLPVLATQLEGGSGTLAVRTRDLPARQRTLRDTIAWSYDLLSAEHQTLFRRLAIFEGGWTTDVATAVAGEAACDILAGLAALVDMHLITPDPGVADEPRFTMLETIREFGRRCLATQDEGDALRRGHAATFVRWGEAVGVGLESGEEQRSLLRAERELPNVRAALRWLRDQGETADGLRLAAALGPFWFTGGHFNEGRSWLTAFLEPPASARIDARTRAAALTWSAVLAAEQGDVGEQQAGADDVISRLEAALTLCREHDDTHGTLRALSWLSYVLMLHEDTERAGELVAEGIELSRAVAAGWWLAVFLYRAAMLAHHGRAWTKGLALAQEAVVVARESGNTRVVARAAHTLALLQMSTRPERLDIVAAAVEESIAGGESAGDRRHVATTLCSLGAIAEFRGDLRLAARCYQQTLTLAGEMGYWHAMAFAVMGTATLTGTRGDHALFARLHGALASHVDVLRRGMAPEYWDSYEEGVVAAREALGTPDFAMAMTEGARLPWAAVISEALTALEQITAEAAAPLPPAYQGAPTGVPTPRHPDGLTPREVEVLQLLAAGRTNQQIADALVLSIRTVERHIETIYSKIGVRGKAARAAAAAYALQHDLT